MKHRLLHNSHPDSRRNQILRPVMLLLILLAFTRLVWNLGAKELWLDEAFSLQRAESDWPALLTGYLPLTDGVRSVDTTDQHPFAYFVFLGLMVRVAGISEFALRFPSLIAATLLVPAAWALARRLARAAALPPTAPLWVMALVAVNPFYLWFGQEVRMYAQVAMLALLSTYLLLRWADTSPQRRRGWLIGYVLALFLLLASHYFAVLILPTHAWILFQALGQRNRRRALLLTAAWSAVALIPGAVALWLLARDPGAGANWSSISLRTLMPDLVNAFSLGLSVDLAQVWPLDLLSAALALAGALFGLRHANRVTRAATRGNALNHPGRGWVLPLLVLAPPALLLAINLIRPAYMTSRHMSLVSGFFVMLVGGGIAWLWSWRRWAGGVVALLLGLGIIFSTWSYFTLPRYANGDVAGMGAYLRERIQPGDLLILQPVPWIRLYRYYLPLDAVAAAEAAGQGISWRALPMLGLTEDETLAELAEWSQRYRRIWLVQTEKTETVNEWLATHAFRADDRAFASPRAAQTIALLLPQSPVRVRPPDTIQHPLDVVFGDQVRLVGYDVGQPLMIEGAALPVTLYWQALSPLTDRYKYILKLDSDSTGEASVTLAATETEPYSGFLPTTDWPADATIVEYTGIPLPVGANLTGARLALQIYDEETLEKLPITHNSNTAPHDDLHTLRLTVGR